MNIPVLYLSLYSQRSLAVTMLNIPVDDYMDLSVYLGFSIEALLALWTGRVFVERDCPACSRKFRTPGLCPPKGGNYPHQPKSPVCGGSASHG